MKFLTIAALMMVCTFAPMASAQDDNRADVTRVADAFLDAQRAQSRADLEHLVAPDYQLVYGRGRVGGKHDVLATLLDPSLHITSIDVVNRTYIPLGRDAAIVGGEKTIRGTNGADPLLEHFRFADALVHRDGQWVVVYTQVTPLPDSAPQPAPATAH
jgi:hypothetical protein